MEFEAQVETTVTLDFCGIKLERDVTAYATILGGRVCLNGVDIEDDEGDTTRLTYEIHNSSECLLGSLWGSMCIQIETCEHVRSKVVDQYREWQATAHLEAA